MDVKAFFTPMPEEELANASVKTIMTIIKGWMRTRIPNTVKSGTEPVSSHINGLVRDSLRSR